MSEKPEVRDQTDPLKHAMELLKVPDLSVHDSSVGDGFRQNFESEAPETQGTSELSDCADDRSIETVSLPKDQLEAFEKLFELISHRAQDASSKLLQTDVRMSIGQIIAYELGPAQPPWPCEQETPASFYHLHSGCFPERLLLKVDAELSAAIIDRMLGGDGNLDCEMGSPMTAMESKLILRWVSDFTLEVQKVLDADWVGVPTVESLEQSTLQEVRAEAGFLTVRVSLKVQVGKHQGQLYFYFPACSFQRFGSSSRYHRIDSSNQLDGPQRVVSSEIQEAKLHLSVKLATAKVKTSDLLGLEVGDIITTEKNSNQAMDLLVQGVPKFKVTPGSHQGKKAVQVERWIDKPEE